MKGNTVNRTHKTIVSSVLIVFILVVLFFVCLGLYVSKNKTLVLNQLMMKKIYSSLIQYEQNVGFIPRENWLDELIQKECDVPNYIQRFKDSKESVLCLNREVLGKRFEEMPANIVLVFETNYDWNQVGDKTTVKTDLYRNRAGANVLFANGEVEFVDSKDLSELIWVLGE